MIITTFPQTDLSTGKHKQLTYTMRIPDCGSVNKLLSAGVFLDSLIFALSPSSLHGMTDGVFDADADLSFPKQKNQKTETSIISVSDLHVINTVHA